MLGYDNEMLSYAVAYAYTRDKLLCSSKHILQTLFANYKIPCMIFCK